MKSNLDDLLKQSLSVHEAEIDAPEVERLSDARRVVEARKWKPVKKQAALLSLLEIIFPKFGLYQAGMLSMAIAGYFFYVTMGHTVNYGSGSVFREESLSPASSNTLASLTPTSNSSSVQSQTVLPSIFTFAIQN